MLDLNLDKRYTYADYFNWLDDVRRELYEGKISLIPQPNRFHQEISGNLVLPFLNFQKKSKFKTFHAPFDVRLVRNGETADSKVTTVVQPDICVICDPKKLDDRGCIGSPDLIIEILSAGNSKRDTVEKFKLYEEYGVREYWIVYPYEHVVHVYLLENEKYKHVGIYAEKDKIPVNIFNGQFEVDLGEVFEDEVF